MSISDFSHEREYQEYQVGEIELKSFLKEEQKLSQKPLLHPNKVKASSC